MNLELLRKIEELRQRAEKSPKNYPTDYTVRLIQAIIAEQQGFKDRKEWIDILYPDRFIEFGK